MQGKTAFKIECGPATHKMSFSSNELVYFFCKGCLLAGVIQGPPMYVLELRTAGTPARTTVISVESTLVESTVSLCAQAETVDVISALLGATERNPVQVRVALNRLKGALFALAHPDSATTIVNVVSCEECYTVFGQKRPRGLPPALSARKMLGAHLPGLPAGCREYEVEERLIVHRKDLHLWALKRLGSTETAANAATLLLGLAR